MALGRRVTLSGEPRSEAPKHLGDSAIYVGSRCVRPRRDANPRIRCPFDRLGAHAGRSAAFLGVMGTTFGRRRFARASDCASPPCKGGVLIVVPQPLMEEASRAWSMSLVPAWQCSIESVREGPTAEVLSQPQALRPPPYSFRSLQPSRWPDRPPNAEIDIWRFRREFPPPSDPSNPPFP